jgi:hypothetical protein
MTEILPKHRAELTEEDKVREAAAYYEKVMTPRIFNFGCGGEYVSSPGEVAAGLAYERVESLYGGHVATRAIVETPSGHLGL